MKIIDKQQDIKLGLITQEELNIVQTKITNRNAASLDKVSTELWKTRKFDDILFRYRNAVYNENLIDRWTKGCILSLLKKGDLGIAKNNRNITLVSIAAKIYNTLILNRIYPEI